MAGPLSRTRAAFDMPQEPDWVNQWDAPVQAQLAKLAGLTTSPRFTPEQVQQRRGRNDEEYALGLLGLLSGDEQLGQVGGQVLKNALSNRQERITERGTVDPITGEFSYDPDYVRSVEESKLEKLQGQQASAAQRRDAEMREREFRRQLAAGQAETRILARSLAAANGPGAGSYSPTGFTPEGDQVVTNSKTGASYIIRQGPQGVAYEPYGGVATPRATFDKQAQEAQEAVAGAKRAEGLVTAVRENPDAFGAKAAAVGTLPGVVQGWAGAAVGLTPEQQQLRAQVTRDAALELNRIYGAAQSAGELARAAAWAPNNADSFETIINKLEAAATWERGRARSFGPGVERAARARGGNTTGGASGGWDAVGAPPPAPGGKGWSIKQKGP